VYSVRSQPNLQNRDVVVTGIGIVSAIGVGAELLFDHLASGRSLIGSNPMLEALGFDNPAATWIGPDILAQADAINGGCDRDWGVHTRIALAAAVQAWRNAGMSEEIPCADADRGGVFYASNRQFFELDDMRPLPIPDEDGRIDFDLFLDAIDHERWPSIYFHRQQDLPSLVVAQRFGLHAQHGAHGEACAGGTIAVGSAFRRIRSGDLDFALAGASESTNNLMMMIAFNTIGALASGGEQAPGSLSRPFDRDRCGFVMSEGSTFMLLESAERAAARGAVALARISGFCGQLESQRITSSDDTGDEYARCMQEAIADAALTSDDIDHINAHGTSTPSNDACEALALKKVFGERISRIPVTANKSGLGHSLGNSGALEAALSVLSLQRQTLLPTLNFSASDEQTHGLRLLPHAQPAEVRRVLSNSFGFGGSNATLIVEAA
jgi:3-oxoacyl-[acyl-carrier-protein] synthase II